MVERGRGGLFQLFFFSKMSTLTNWIATLMKNLFVVGCFESREIGKRKWT